MARRYTRWPKRSVDFAMSLRGTMSTRAAELETGIPAGTISDWWAGRSDPYRGPGQHRGTKHNPRTHCLRGHRLTPSNTIWYERADRRQCRRCKRLVDRRYQYRRRGRFHPELNPNLDLAPLDHLWFNGPAVLEELLEGYTWKELSAEVSSTDFENLWRWRKGDRNWASYQIVDRLCLSLGFPASSLKLEPVYATHPSLLSRRAS